MYIHNGRRDNEPGCVTTGYNAGQAEWTAGQAQQSVPKTDITLSSGIKNEPVGQIAVRVRAGKRQRQGESERERAEAISEIYCRVSFLA